MNMPNRIWVLCTHCSSKAADTLFGSKPVGLGKNCPTCGSNWGENQVIASTAGKSLSPILGDVGSEKEKSSIKVIWLTAQSGKP